MEHTVTITFEGRTIVARHGESVAAALTAAGVTVFRRTRSGAERGMFCGMGVCQDCLVRIDGKANQLEGFENFGAAYCVHVGPFWCWEWGCVGYRGLVRPWRDGRDHGGKDQSARPERG